MLNSVETISLDLLVILAVGFVAGAICRRLGVSLLVGYLIAGALIGAGGLGLVPEGHHEVEYLAEIGVLLLLFSIGLEFSLEELARLSRFIFIGGSIQLFLTALPVIGILIFFKGLPWNASLLLGFAVAMSSTVLVFKVLSEYGLTGTRGGRRAISVLLFQDVAVVPLLLMIPILTGNGQAGVLVWLLLAVKTAAVILGVLLLRYTMRRWIVPLFVKLRSAEVIVLFAMAVLVGLTYVMYQLGLPAPMGAFFAGLAMSGNRISVQVDALILPFREIFSAIFFVSLGLLFDPGILRSEPLLVLVGLVVVIGLKWLAASVAVRLTRLPWRSAFGVGLGLAHIGEFAFVLGFAALRADLIEQVDYQRLLIFALGSLLITPQMIRIGMRWGEPAKWPELPPDEHPSLAGHGGRSAIVVGIGPVGRQVMNRLEQRGIHTCAIDLSPVNLHALAMQGLHTVAGDARDPQVLKTAGADSIELAVICVPNDDAAVQVVGALRSVNKNCMILVRCRYLANTSVLEKAGANQVISEEAQASSALLAILGTEPGGPQDIVPG